MKLTLKATDDAGQEARTETKTFVLPERTFTNPLAKADRRAPQDLVARRQPQAATCST